MDSTSKIKSKQIGNLHSNYLSLNQTLSVLDCSKFYLYKLVNKGILKQYRLEKDSSGRPVGKPYFSFEEIQGAFSTD